MILVDAEALIVAVVTLMIGLIVLERLVLKYIQSDMRDGVWEFQVVTLLGHTHHVLTPLLLGPGLMLFTTLHAETPGLATMGQVDYKTTMELLANLDIYMKLGLVRKGEKMNKILFFLIGLLAIFGSIMFLDNALLKEEIASISIRH